MEYDRIYSIRKGEYFADALKRAGKDFTIAKSKNSRPKNKMCH